MPLIGCQQLLPDARNAGRGVAAFNVAHLEQAEALVQAATAADSAVIMQLSQNAVDYHGALEPIGSALLAIARAAATPVVVHLDHATDEDLIDEAIALGFTSVMYDAAHQEYARNVDRTAAVVRQAHRHGVWVEAELGEIGGKDGVHAPGARTDPQEAAAFVAATGVDALAVAVGSSHAMTRRTAALDLPLVKELFDAVAVPLVLHGSSGLSDDQIGRAVRTGLTKINMATHLNAAFTHAVRGFLREQPGVVDSRRYLAAGRTGYAAEAARLIPLIRQDSPAAAGAAVRTPVGLGLRG